MIRNKILIAIIISALSFTVITALTERKESPLQKEKADSSALTILADIVKEEGWTQGKPEQYAFLLQNSNTNLRAETEKIAGLPGAAERAYLYSLLLKKEADFKGMFDSLISVLPLLPANFDYYDQLAFAANATGQFTLLGNKAEAIKLPALLKLYLGAFSNAYKGEYRYACKDFLSIIKSDSGNYEALYQLSYMYRHIGEYDSAFSALEKAVLISGADDIFKVKALIAEGTLNYLSSNMKQAERLYKKALEISEKKQYNRHLSTSLINLGIIYDDKGNYENARDSFSRALNIADNTSDIEGKAFALSEWGVSYTLTGDIIEAKYKYLQCYSLYEKINDRLRLSFLSENIAKLYIYQLDYLSALKYFEKGLDYSGDNAEAKVLNLTGMADVYANLSNYSKALQLYREAREYSSQIKSLSLSPQINNSIGSLNFNLNRYRNALTYFTKGAAESISSGDIYTAAELNYKTGLTYLMIDSLESAEQFLLKSLELTGQSGDIHTEALVLMNLASLEIKRNNIPAANNRLGRASHIINRNKLSYLAAESCLIRGDIQKRERNFAAAKDNYLKALNTSLKVNEPNIRIDIYAALGKLFADNNLPEAADSYYRSAISSIEDVSRLLYEEEGVQIAYFSGKSDVYNAYTDFLLDNNRYEEAFEVIDKSRSRSTVQKLDNLKFTNLIKDESLLSKLYDYEWIIQSGIYGKAAADSVSLLLSVLKQEIEQQYPSAKAYLERKQGLTVKTIQQALKDDEVLVSVYSNKNASHIFVLTPGSFKHHEADLSQKETRKYLKAVSPYYSEEDSSNSFFNQDLFAFNSEASNKLYNKLFRETFSKIQKGKKIIVIPSAELLTFPVEMFVVNYRKDDSPYRYPDKDFLLNHFSISYTPSASAYIHQKENLPGRNSKSIVIGDPAINTTGSGFTDRRGLLEDAAGSGIPRNVSLLPLKYSSEEAREVQEIINADKIFLNSNATETNFKKNALYSSIIHLSTHSFLYNNQPVIFFSNIFDPENDGFLEAGEIAGLSLNSDLVVLSSCNSGLGTIDNAEGILGMTKAFFEAGSRSVVVSLWEVNDKYTSRFMSLFYNNLKSGYDKSAALRQAKLEFIKTYSANPYYWGAFVLSGDCSEIKIADAASVFPYFLIIIALAGAFIVITFFIRRRERTKAAIT
jgi:CHAT domain-containing protein/Flp pilus assembly protein TadD